MKKSLVNIVLLLAVCNVYGQTVNIVPASYAAGGVSVARSGDWLPFHNPAISATLEKPELIALYQNRFGVKELSSQVVAVSLPVSSLNIGVSCSHFGYAGYSELLGGVSFAHSFDKVFSIGVQFNYYSVTVSHSDGNKGVLLAQIGFLSEISQGFYVGFNAFNPTNQKVKYQELVKDVPSVFSLGAMYEFSESFAWLTQLDKELNSLLIWRTGFEYLVVPVLQVRLGAFGMPFCPTLGCGVKWKSMAFDVDFERHPVLGITSVGALRFKF